MCIPALRYNGDQVRGKVHGNRMGNLVAGALGSSHALIYHSIIGNAAPLPVGM